MIAQFPSPVLSVAADVVEELDGEDALYALWNLFTKCKESLKDGRRLENISWRLWYREIAAAQHSPFSSPGSLSPPYSEKRSSPPITPISEDGHAHNHPSVRPLLDSAALPSVHSWHGDQTSLNVLAAGRRLSTASAPAHHVHPHPAFCVGKMIVGILPEKLSLVASTNREAAQNVKAIDAPVKPTSDVPTIVQPRPVVAVQMSTTPSAAGPAPRVVVVNPTPHPTPPATPSIPRGASAVPRTTDRPARLLPPPPTQNGHAAARAPAVIPVKPAVTTSRDPTTRVSGDATLKPSDRRFFLQGAAESPERDSPDSVAKQAEAKSDVHTQSPSSVASSQLRSDGGGRPSGIAAKKGMMKAHARKSKETVRHVPARAVGMHRVQTQTQLHRTQTQAQLHRQAGQRKTANGEKKTTFNIGSLSSNGSRDGGAVVSQQAQKEPAPIKPQPEPPSKQAHAHGAVQPPRRGIVVTSSEYETDTEDDSEWASENSADEREKRQRGQREESKVREAAEEAQRQRDMFAKVPKRSYSNLNRTRSGLLSQLLNPDPNLFPPNHPYRIRGFSSQDMTQFGRQGAGRAAPTLQTSKSTAAMPVAAQVTAQAPTSNGSVAAKSHAHRHKGRPQSAEMEDESDSEEEGLENALEMSKSVAQQKLAKFADANPRRQSERAPAPAERPVRPTILSVATAPIPLGHPYNLPAPAPPMTPRTTRRQMLATELSESLRRNLLWERQVSRNNLTSGRRGGLLGNPLRPLTTVHGNQSNSGTNSGNEDEHKQRAMSRNRSWADDYHYAGW
ncbi:uncharacterized protein LAESUDRAFT_687411 [Laetiporus sulphureus 93-53]|uniref:Uncharacterized protein n=1 Tax=Laetiporus sulphureus 93-53 TaxID=1314785 RepID=A0A165BFQ1_9APHY|nr:uncharacterized protein LAESUDRAFT_687411 [Laetiporus sulphureus 93-53]KZT00959.1 hypothetical protein LAESUDRAFT_687411 [Laetiporus sulphureus 93-53]